jgi:hypothetical protein
VRAHKAAHVLKTDCITERETCRYVQLAQKCEVHRVSAVKMENRNGHSDYLRWRHTSRRALELPHKGKAPAEATASGLRLSVEAVELQKVRPAIQGDRD